MNILLPVLALAAFGLGKSKSTADSKAPAPLPDGGKSVADLKKQILEESLDIVHGKRDTYSDDQAMLDIAAKQAVEAADKAAREDAERKAAQKTAPPAPKPAPYVAPPAPKPAPYVAPPAPKPAPYVAPPAPKPAPPTPIIVAPPRPAPNPIAPKPTPVPGPTPGPASKIPPGYDPAGARKVAPALARHLKNKGRANYDRRLLEDFQRKAGITPDRIYGGESFGALKYYGGTDAPPPFFPPLQLVPYVPPEQRK